MYFRETNGFAITVEPEFISEEYSGGHRYFIYSYTVTIQNIVIQRANCSVDIGL